MNATVNVPDLLVLKDLAEVGPVRRLREATGVGGRCVGIATAE